MDTDDICAPDRFEKQIAYIQAHPEVDILALQLQSLMRYLNNLLQ